MATLTKLSDGNSYQCQELRNLSHAKSFHENKHDEFNTSVTACIKGRLAWSDLMVIQDVTYLCTRNPELAEAIR